MRRFFACMLGVGLLVGMAEARTWKSASGHSLEADLVRKDGDVVILKTSDGKMVRIGLNRLSKADQEFVVKGGAEKEMSFEEVIATTKDEVKPAVEPKKEAPKPKTPKKPALFAYEEVPAFPSSDLPELKLKKPDDVRYYGYQYGPKKDEVIYFAFDYVKESSPADYCFVYAPKIPAYAKPQPVRAKKKTFLKDKANAFGPFMLNTTFNDMKVQYELTMYSGYSKWWLIAPYAEVKVTKSGAACEFMIVKNSEEDVTSGEGDIMANPLLRDPVFSASPHFDSRRKEFWLDLKMGSYRMTPGKGMSDEFELLITKEDGKKAETIDVDIEEEKALEEHAYRIKAEKLKPGLKYNMAATLDMGKVFGGPREITKAFTMPEPEEKK